MLTEWQVLKEKWFHGETIDPVFEGVVRDFCTFDETMHNVYQKVGVFMRGVEQLATGMTALSEGVTAGLTHANDSQIASDSCKLKEATNQIARADAPHSAIAKLRRDMQFNILTPVQNHIANNRNLKVSLDIRRRRLIELNGAKKQFDDVTKRNLLHTDRRYLQAQSTYESTKMIFNDVDRHVFEWLYILEEYRGDILDSTLQTLKYLEYEFFATSAHAVSTSLPSRMEFRPMVEMTPEHLEAQVEMELQEMDDNGTDIEGVGISPITDFSARLIDKKAKEDPSDNSGPLVSVDPLSLSSLLSQGFEEGPARRALRLHQNNTQAALDWLIDGQNEEAEKRSKVADGVRMPTTVKRVQKLKAMRKAQAEKLKAKQGKTDDTPSKNAGTGPTGNSDSSSSTGAGATSGTTSKSKQEPVNKVSTQPKPDLLEDLVEMDKGTPPKAKNMPMSDLLSLNEEEPALPTDFSKPIERTELPPQLSFDVSMCEKPPLPAAVAAGIVQPRHAPPAPPDLGMSLPQELNFGGAPAATTPGGMLAGMTPELMSAVQALAAQSQVSPEQLLRAAQQLANQQATSVQPAVQPMAQQAAMPTYTSGGGGYPAPPGPTTCQQPGLPQMLAGGDTPSAAKTLEELALNPLGLAKAVVAPSGSSGDRFGELVALAGGSPTYHTDPNGPT